MPERVYMNRRTGEERIHIEITYGEINELLAHPAGEPARRLWQLLATAHRQFTESTPAPELTAGDLERAADDRATAHDHARGDHEQCGPTCETAFPSEQLRNFILAKGYPGTASTLDELLRRAAETSTRTAVLEEALTVARDEGHRLEEIAGIEAARGARCVAYLLSRLAKAAPQPAPTP